MLGRRRIDTPAPLRSSLANAAFAVEERVVWGGFDILRGVLDAVKWPFERAVWAVERGLVWPLEERTGDWSGPLRAAGVAALALFAVAAGVLGLVWASGSGTTTARQTQPPSAPIATPIVKQAPKEGLAQAAPILHGAAPDFTPEAGGGVTGVSGTSAKKAPAETAVESTSTTADASSTGSPTTTKVEPAGPAATKVARQFAGAFVLFETGQDNAKVRAAFAATATPQLAHSLLQRPPRLPADVEVPKAKVLNVVPGQKHGNTYTLSVSLLRVGITSELRIDMQRDEKTGEWRVTDVLG